MKIMILCPVLLVLVSACATVPQDTDDSGMTASTRGTAVMPTSSEPTAEPISAEEIRSGATRIVSAAEFIDFLDHLESDLDKGIPRELGVFERRRVSQISGELRDLLDGVQSIEHLNNNQKIAIYNTTQDLWATVIGRDDDRLICHREHQVGSHFKRTRCRTLREIRREQRESYQYLRMIRGPGPMPAGG